MSHFKERKEKICLNCNTELQDRYCHVCGQQNIEPKETVWHLVTHFFSDITHFDGNFFKTLNRLLLRPGFLSKEYMLGRRARYINPIRMYIFTSAFFFLIFFIFFIGDDTTNNKTTTINGKTFSEIAIMDSAGFADFTREINRKKNKPDIPMSRKAFKNYFDSGYDTEEIILVMDYQSRAQYDSLLRNGIKKHNWLTKQFFYKLIAVKEKYKNNGKQLINALLDKIMHSLPQLLFIFLPLLALLLKLLYFRRKEFYYVNHAIFSIHLYIFIFIALLFYFSLNKLNGQLHWVIFKFVNIAIGLSILFYTYKAMRKFYGQRRGKTIAKYMLLLFSFLLLMTVLYTVLLFFSFFTI